MAEIWFRESEKWQTFGSEREREYKWKDDLQGRDGRDLIEIVSRLIRRNGTIVWAVHQVGPPGGFPFPGFQNRLYSWPFLGGRISQNFSKFQNFGFLHLGTSNVSSQERSNIVVGPTFVHVSRKGFGWVWKVYLERVWSLSDGPSGDHDPFV